MKLCKKLSTVDILQQFRNITSLVICFLSEARLKDEFDTNKKKPRHIWNVKKVKTSSINSQTRTFRCDKTEVTSKNGAMSLNFDFTAAEIIEDGRCDRKHIEEIKDWMKSMSLPKATEEQIVLFLISCCSNIESTKSTILSYYRHMYLGKNITNNRNIHSKELIQQIKIM